MNKKFNALNEKASIELETPDAFVLVPKIEGTKGILRINAVTGTSVRITYNDKIFNDESIKALVTAKNKGIKENINIEDQDLQELLKASGYIYRNATKDVESFKAKFGFDPSKNKYFEILKNGLVFIPNKSNELIKADSANTTNNWNALGVKNEKANIELSSPDALELADKLTGKKGILRANAITTTKITITYNDKVHNPETIKALVDKENKSLKENKIVETFYITDESKHKFLIFDDATNKATFTENMSLAKTFETEESAKEFKKAMDEKKILGFAKSYVIDKADYIKEKVGFISNMSDFKKFRLNESDYLRNFGNEQKPITIETTKESAAVLQSLITNVPMVKVDTGNLGNDHLYILVCLDARETWPHGYLENSDYFRMSLSNRGELEQFTNGLDREYRIKFRKAKAKSIDDAALKINNYILTVQAARNEHKPVSENYSCMLDINDNNFFQLLDAEIEKSKNDDYYGTVEADECMDQLFVYAKKYGFDYEEEPHGDYLLKATNTEALEYLKQEMLKLMSGKSNEAAYKPNKFESIPVKVGDVLYDADNGKPGYYNYRKVLNIENDKAEIVTVDVFNGRTETKGSPYKVNLSTVQNWKDLTNKKSHDNTETVNQITHEILTKSKVEKLIGGDLQNQKVGAELIKGLKALKTAAENYSTKSDSIPAGGFSGANSSTMSSSRSGIPVSWEFNGIHRGGSYGFDRAYIVLVKIGGALETKIKQSISNVAMKLLSKYSFNNDYGNSRIDTSSGTNYNSVMLTSPESNNRYFSLPYLNKIGENTNEAAQTQDIFKSKLFTFLDYPWDNKSETEFVSKVAADRSKFTTANENTVKAYLKNLYSLNEESIKSKCSKKFIYDYQQLLESKKKVNSVVNEGAVEAIANLVKDANTKGRYLPQDIITKIKETGIKSSDVFSLASLFKRNTFKTSYILDGKLENEIKRLYLDDEQIQNNITKVQALKDLVNYMDENYGSDRSWTKDKWY